MGVDRISQGQVRRATELREPFDPARTSQNRSSPSQMLTRCPHWFLNAIVAIAAACVKRTSERTKSITVHSANANDSVLRRPSVLIFGDFSAFLYRALRLGANSAVVSTVFSLAFLLVAFMQQHFERRMSVFCFHCCKPHPLHKNGLVTMNPLYWTAYCPNIQKYIRASSKCA